MSKIQLLDTNVYRIWTDTGHGSHGTLLRQIQAWGDRYIFLSSITVGEVEFGLRRRHSLDPIVVQRIRAGLSHFGVLDIDRHVAEPYGQIRAWLVERYLPAGKRRLKSLSQLADPTTDRSIGIQENDLWLASQALTYDATLVSFDKLTRIREAALHCGLTLNVTKLKER